MDDEEKIARSTANFYGFSAKEALEARRLVELPPDDFAARFAELASFAKTFGVGLVDLATFVASGSGIESYENITGISSEEWGRISDAQERLATRGDWARTILALLNAAEGRPRPMPASPRSSTGSTWWCSRA